MLIPSCLYVLQNNLLFLALANLDAGTYQVTYELKIMTAAIFSVLMLQKKLDSRQWVALVMLTIGVSLVQVPQIRHATAKDSPEKQANLALGNKLAGLAAVLCATILSGFSGVFYEKMIKTGAQPSLIIRNIQLGFPSILFSLGAVVFNDLAVVMSDGLLQGYTPIVWVIVLLQAFGGMIVALVIKFADNIIKGFSSAISIIVSSIGSYLLLHDLLPDIYFLIGACLVIASIFMYSAYSLPANSATSVADCFIRACGE